MRQDRSTTITETAEEPTGCGPDVYGGFAHHHRSVLDHRRSGLTSAEKLGAGAATELGGIFEEFHSSWTAFVTPKTP